MNELLPEPPPIEILRSFKETDRGREVSCGKADSCLAENFFQSEVRPGVLCPCPLLAAHPVPRYSASPASYNKLQEITMAFMDLQQPPASSPITMNMRVSQIKLSLLWHFPTTNASEFCPFLC